MLNYWLWLFLWLDMWSLQPDAMGNLINCDAWMAYVLDEKVAATREIINLRNQWICTLRGVAKDMDTKRARHVFRMMVKPTSIRATSATTSFDNNTCCWWNLLAAVVVVLPRSWKCRQLANPTVWRQQGESIVGALL